MPQNTFCCRLRSVWRELLLVVVALGVASQGRTFFFKSKAGRIMGQGMATTQFYLHGRRHFTQTGWETHSSSYPTPDPLDSVELSGRSYVVTGANAGIGREMASFLARKGGKVFMVCRDKARGETAREELLLENDISPDRLVILVGDMGLQRDVRQVASAVAEASPQGIDALVCNAGALLNERTLTDEGIEVTFATHFLFGSYLLTKLLLPSLRAAGGAGREPRVVLVSSGGMYNTAFPKWSVAASQVDDETQELPAYSGQLAYAYAKRGQVLLCERWAQTEELRGSGEQPVTFVSAHPGWTGTKAVQEAYGETASWLEPMRNIWQGAEGICWLCTASAKDLEPGAFYLDRKPQVKHMAGPFFTEGSFTQNSAEEVDVMLEKADALCGLS